MYLTTANEAALEVLMNPTLLDLAAVLFGMLSGGESLYAILDGARTFDIPFRLRSANVAHDSLYEGRSKEVLWHVAPYLVYGAQDAAFFHWVLEQGWGDSWGIFLTSQASLEDLHRHFRHFLLVKTEDDRELFFRFYDPRVLRVFLPTCAPEGAMAFFGPVSCYLMEGEQPNTLLKFMTSQDGVKQEVLFLTAPNEPRDGNFAS
jgi:Domain of unknown function (DUF4123)